MHSRSNNIGTIINDKEDEAKEELFNHFFLHINLGWKYQRKVLISRWTLFIYYIANFIKQT